MEPKLELAETTKDRFVCKGVFLALDFAFRNADIVGLDQESKEYCEIKRAYWSMPWAESTHVEALDTCCIYQTLLLVDR